MTEAQATRLDGIIRRIAKESAAVEDLAVFSEPPIDRQAALACTAAILMLENALRKLREAQTGPA